MPCLAAIFSIVGEKRCFPFILCIPPFIIKISNHCCSKISRIQRSRHGGSGVSGDGWLVDILSQAVSTGLVGLCVQHVDVDVPEVCLSECGLQQWYLHHNNILLRAALTSAMLSICLTMLSVSYCVLQRSVSGITLCRESQVKVAWWVAVSSFTSHIGLVRTLHSARGFQSDIRGEIILGLYRSHLLDT